LSQRTTPGPRARLILTRCNSSMSCLL